MMNIEKIYSDIKKQFGNFLLNQSVINELRKKISNIKDPQLREQLSEMSKKLLQRQKELEDYILNWMRQVVNLKEKIERGVYDNQIFSEGIKYVKEGMKISIDMLAQNNEVKKLKEYVQNQKITTDNRENFIKLMYGGLGILLLLYLINKKNEK